MKTAPSPRHDAARLFGGLLLAPTLPPVVLAQESAIELPNVSVQADSDKPEGCRATATCVGKVLKDPHDIPQAVTSLTGALLEEQQVGSPGSHGHQEITADVNKANDQPTADLQTQRIEVYEMTAWMLRSLLED
jgi:hypothetical protein